MGFKGAKEAFGVPDPAQGMDRRTAKRIERAGRLRVEQAHRIAGGEPHVRFALTRALSFPHTAPPRGLGTWRESVPHTLLLPRALPFRHAAVHGHEVDRREAARRLPQRPGRQASPVSVAPRSIDDGDLDVAGKPQMLQPVVAQNDIAFGTPVQGACRGGAVRAGGDRAAGAAGEQHRFIADEPRIAAGMHVLRPSARAAPYPRQTTPARSPRRARSFAIAITSGVLPAPPHTEIADDDDRTTDTPERRSPAR